MNHPDRAELALFAGGDLRFFERLRVRLHLGGCSECLREVESFRAAAHALHRDHDQLPSGLNWEQLAEEMTANIHVGLEAGQCVAVAAKTRTMAPRWRATAMVAAMSALLLAAWVLNPPARRMERAAPVARAEIRNTDRGLEVNENGNVFVLLHGGDVQAQKPIVVSAPGALRARFVDSDTGQITITHVYAE